MEKSEIFFGAIKVGDFIFDETDFPNIFGTIERSEIIDPVLKQKLMDYIAFWIEVEKIGTDDDFGDCWLTYIEQHEIEHLDLIDSDQWRLIKPDGVIFSITAPVFHTENQISFR